MVRRTRDGGAFDIVNHADEGVLAQVKEICTPWGDTAEVMHINYWQSQLGQGVVLIDWDDKQPYVDIHRAEDVEIVFEMMASVGIYLAPHYEPDPYDSNEWGP